jgi:hypothetical protein
MFLNGSFKQKNDTGGVWGNSPTGSSQFVVSRHYQRDVAYDPAGIKVLNQFERLGVGSREAQRAASPSASFGYSCERVA